MNRRDDRRDRSHEPADLRNDIERSRASRSWGSIDLRDHLYSHRHIGPRCFGPVVRAEKFSDNFKPPREVARYDSKVNPALWLEDYEKTMMIKNARELIIVRYLPMMLKDAARNWIHGLCADSINSWYEMCRVFIRNFKGTYKHLATDKDIENCVQHKKREHLQIPRVLG
jgi:hypothetical protein